MMKVKNKSEVTLNERDSLQDMLDCEKQLMDLYGEALKEGSGKALRKELAKHYMSCADGQFSVFEEMRARGYYRVQPAQKQQLDAGMEEFRRVEKQLAGR